MCRSTLSLTWALDRVGWSTPRPSRFVPWKETRYPLCRRRGGPQGQSGQVQKIFPPSEFDPRTEHPASSCCTETKQFKYSLMSMSDNSILPHFMQRVLKSLWKICFCYLINFLMNFLMIYCWLTTSFNYLVAVVMKCWCLQTNFQVTLTVHLRRTCVAGLKRKWRGCDRMAHMLVALVWTTPTKMHQVGFYTISWMHSVCLP